ncbi:MAG: kelch repeat-containing protein [Acidobacteriota bacterium]
MTTVHHKAQRATATAFLVAMTVSASRSAGQPLTIERRIACQKAIEEVYWRHRLWPRENPGPKPALAELMPDSSIEVKVQDYVKESVALERYWHRNVTGAQLQAEIDRMLRESRDPSFLRELFGSLGDDPVLIAECLARPALVSRLAQSHYRCDDRLHGELKARATAALERCATAVDMRSVDSYQEVVWTKEDSRGSVGSWPGLSLPASEWSLLEGSLRRLFGAARPPLNRPSSLQEDAYRFYATAIVELDESHIRTATIEWRKRPFQEWLHAEPTASAADIPIMPYAYTIGAVGARAPRCPPDTWSPTAIDRPLAMRHTAIWTGSEMIIWGGTETGVGPALASGGRYEPATDTWAPAGTNLLGAPAARCGHSAVWTGTEMIVWGGSDDPAMGTTTLDTGGRYDPVTDTWAAGGTSLTNAPSPRAGQTAVWTGSRMLVWGGYDGTTTIDTGGIYDPGTDTWLAISSGNAPSPRAGHSAVWTGTEMIVWGGTDPSVPLGTGGRFDPTINVWNAGGTAMANAPTPRYFHTAVWTGSEMIVWGGWGGSYLDTGARYDPVADAWLPGGTSTTNAPRPRRSHTAVWTGSEMLVWGGDAPCASICAGDFGGRYSPSTDSWNDLPPSSLETPRYAHTAIWTGSEMIVWGGTATAAGAFFGLDDGGRYDPVNDNWSPVSMGGVPSPRSGHSAVWTGTEMVVWGGFLGVPSTIFDDGARYDPAVGIWSPTTSVSAPSGHVGHSAVWTGTNMVVWGGQPAAQYGLPDIGGLYDPATDSWSVMAPRVGRAGHSAVWTGSEMIVWGGENLSGPHSDGSRYNPQTNTWTPTALTNAPSARASHSAVWTGAQMVVWGGDDGSTQIGTGGLYDPTANSWNPAGTSTVGAPSARTRHTAVWTGQEMIVWGGDDGTPYTQTGGRYVPTTDSWIAGGTSTVNAPSARGGHTALWTGTDVIVWGGADGIGSTDTGGIYDPVAEAWLPGGTSTANAPSPRVGHSAVWTGSQMIVWGGTVSYDTNTGGIYCPEVTRVDFLLGQGLGQPNPNEVKVFDESGAPTAVDFLAYAAGQWGVNVAAGNVDTTSADEIVTGPGPGPVFGPQVRGFFRDGLPIGKINYFAYGTLRFGVNVASARLDADAFGEILSGAGPGDVFGPHVRGWNFDGSGLSAIAKISYFSYGTLKYGVNVASGSVDADTYAEILTGPGPGIVFGPQVRGWDYDAASITSINKINYLPFTTLQYGVNVAGGDFDGDGYAEMATTPGPGSGPSFPPRFLGHNYDGANVAAMPGFDVTPITTSYGGRVGAGDVSHVGRDQLLTGAGRDPVADSTVRAYDYASAVLAPLSPISSPFGVSTYGVNVAGGGLGY